ncbi:MAG: kinase [Acidimicrobiales bacterium]|nr:kinase [Acidimicrobiales bacterium]
MAPRFATPSSSFGPFEIPTNLVCAWQDGRRDWLVTLPGIVRQVAEAWSLSVGSPFQPGGSTAWVAPVQRPDGGDLVVKVAMRHPEADHEADGLRLWKGEGAVRIVATQEFEGATALLLERCVPGTMLKQLPEPAQDEVIAGLLKRLWCDPPAGHPFRPLQTMCDNWADQFETKVGPNRPPLDQGMIRDGIELFRALPASAERNVLLATDLHAGNVLSAEREPWLAIDPKPYVGDPTYDALQHMLSCEDRLHADPRALAARMAHLLDLDHDRLLLWLFARCVQESVDCPTLAIVARQVAPT